MVENTFLRIKSWRGIATRYAKNTASFLAAVQIRCIALWRESRDYTVYRESIIIKDHVKVKHIIVGDYSYYSGYYHGRPFEDCVMYLDSEETDRLIIGKFCSIATGVKFMMGGNQGHNYEWIANYPLDFLDEDFDGYNSVPPKAYKLKGDTV